MVSPVRSTKNKNDQHPGKIHTTEAFVAEIHQGHRELAHRHSPTSFLSIIHPIPNFVEVSHFPVHIF